MRKILYFLVLLPLILVTGCDDCDCDHNHDDNNYYIYRDPINRVLMLKIDRPNNTLGGAIEYLFPQQTNSFNIDIINDTLENFKTVRLVYRELNDTLFMGTILPTGLGEMTFPEALDAPDLFDTVTTDDVVYPLNGFDHIPFEYILQYTYYNLWLQVQKYVKVRQFLLSNPNQKVKIFLYIPYEGPWDNSKTDWYIFIKN